MLKFVKSSLLIGLSIVMGVPQTHWMVYIDLYGKSEDVSMTPPYESYGIQWDLGSTGIVHEISMTSP